MCSSSSSSLSSPFIICILRVTREICKAGLTRVGSTSIGITIGKVSSSHETSISSRNWSSSCQKKERRWVTKIDLQVSSWEENWCYCQLQIMRNTLFRGKINIITKISRLFNNFLFSGFLVKVLYTTDFSLTYLASTTRWCIGNILHKEANTLFDLIQNRKRKKGNLINLIIWITMTLKRATITLACLETVVEFPALSLFSFALLFDVLRSWEG